MVRAETAQPHQAGDPIVTSDNVITRLLSAPVRPDWTVDRLAEEVLGAIAAQPTPEGQEFILDAGTATNRQSQRILRPLLACLATKSAAETATSPNLYGGLLWFKRTGPEGPVWILGHFENKPGMVQKASVMNRSQGSGLLRAETSTASFLWSPSGPTARYFRAIY